MQGSCSARSLKQRSQDCPASWNLCCYVLPACLALQVKLPKQGSLTIVNSGANEPQFLDLTHLGPKHRTGINVKLPNVETKGEQCFGNRSGHMSTHAHGCPMSKQKL